MGGRLDTDPGGNSLRLLPSGSDRVGETPVRRQSPVTTIPVAPPPSNTAVQAGAGTLVWFEYGTGKPVSRSRRPVEKDCPDWFLDSRSAFFDDDNAVTPQGKSTGNGQIAVFVIVISVDDGHQFQLRRLLGRNINGPVTGFLFDLAGDGGLDDGEPAEKGIGLEDVAVIVAVADADDVRPALAQTSDHRRVFVLADADVDHWHLGPVDEFERLLVDLGATAGSHETHHVGGDRTAGHQQRHHPQGRPGRIDPLCLHRNLLRSPLTLGFYAGAPRGLRTARSTTKLGRNS